MADFLLQKEQLQKKQDDIDRKSQAYRAPILATSGIIEVVDEKGNMQGIILIDRCNPPLGKALPGGLVEYGEDLKQTLKREMYEEINLSVYDIEQFQAYSNPKRDPRFHVVDIVHIAKAKGAPIGGTDAAKAFVVKLSEIPWTELAFDHAEILRDYLQKRHPEALKDTQPESKATIEASPSGQESQTEISK